jgi:hypothetical protein
VRCHKSFIYRTCSSTISRLFKTVYPNGLQSYATPSTTPLPSRRGSDGSLPYSVIQSKPTTAPKSGFFSRWFTPSTSVAAPGTITNPPSGPVEELVLSGTAFGTFLHTSVLSHLIQGCQDMGCLTWCFLSYLQRLGVLLTVRATSL